MNKEEYGKYIEEQKIRMEKGYLTRSERTHLNQMIANPDLYVKDEKKTEPSTVKSIVTDRTILQKACKAVEKGEDVKGIIKELKDALKAHPEGIGLSANQIGYDKKISLIVVPHQDPSSKKLGILEYVLINAQINFKTHPIQIKNEGCLSFPGIYINTRRYVTVGVYYLNEKMEEVTQIFTGLDALAVQHEIDHTQGITLFQRKHIAK